MEPMANEHAVQQDTGNTEAPAMRLRSRKVRKELNQETVDALVRRLCHLLDAGDFFGRNAMLPPLEKIGKLFLATAEDQNQSEFNCAVSPKVRQQVPLLFQAMAGVMEERTGLMIQSTAEINGEGFGRGCCTAAELSWYSKAYAPAPPSRSLLQRRRSGTGWSV